MTDVSFPEAGRRIQAAVDFGDSDSVKALMDQWENILEPGSGIRELVEDAAVRLYIGDVFRKQLQKRFPSPMNECWTMRWNILLLEIPVIVKI